MSDSSEAYEILPTNSDENEAADSNDHIIKKRSLKEINKRDEEFVLNIKKRAALNGVPVNAYVELLIVTDTSVLDNFISQSNSNDLNIVFSNMRLYYAYAVHAVILLYKVATKIIP